MLCIAALCFKEAIFVRPTKERKVIMYKVIMYKRQDIWPSIRCLQSTVIIIPAKLGR